MASWNQITNTPSRVTTQPVGSPQRGPLDMTGNPMTPPYQSAPYLPPSQSGLPSGTPLPGAIPGLPGSASQLPVSPSTPPLGPTSTMPPPMSYGNDVVNAPATATPFQAQQGTTVNLPGWDSSRTDTDPKQIFGQFAQQWQASGKPWDADAVRSFVQQDPRWEIDPASSPQDPRIRVKQDILNTWKPGMSVWQDVIGDSGGQNRVQYMNDPASAAALGFGPGGTPPIGVEPKTAATGGGMYDGPGGVPMYSAGGDPTSLYGSSFGDLAGLTPEQQAQKQALKPAQPGGLNRWMLPQGV